MKRLMAAFYGRMKQEASDEAREKARLALRREFTVEPSERGSGETRDRRAEAALKANAKAREPGRYSKADEIMSRPEAPLPSPNEFSLSKPSGREDSLQGGLSDRLDAVRPDVHSAARMALRTASSRKEDGPGRAAAHQGGLNPVVVKSMSFRLARTSEMANDVRRYAHRSSASRENVAIRAAIEILFSRWKQEIENGNPKFSRASMVQDLDEVIVELEAVRDFCKGRIEDASH